MASYGDDIDAEVGSGGRNVAVGKDIRQTDNRKYYGGEEELSPLDRIRLLEREMYGNTRSGQPGIAQQVRSLQRSMWINTAIEVCIGVLVLALLLKIF